MNIKDFLKEMKTKDKCNIKIKGIINFEIILNKIEAVEDKDNIWLMNGKQKILGINKHQIAKIFLDKEKNMIIRLDQLLEIHIITKK